jgi:hypothetical protein
MNTGRTLLLLWLGDSMQPGMAHGISHVKVEEGALEMGRT